uniref:Uncharacterized protein n=1 Tax=Meloidogyne enterolobii TaxID=390850 RepID=A0A6V7UQT7_MELEN|nr:unnamed protein product [Meloidogyne enterolobii]
MRGFLLTKHVYVATEIIKMLQSNNEIWAYDLRYNLIMQVAATQSYEDLRLIRQLIFYLSEGKEKLNFNKIFFEEDSKGISKNFLNGRFFYGTKLQFMKIFDNKVVKLKY